MGKTILILGFLTLATLTGCNQATDQEMQAANEVCARQFSPGTVAYNDCISAKLDSSSDALTAKSSGGGGSLTKSNGGGGGF